MGGENSRRAEFDSLRKFEQAVGGNRCVYRTYSKTGAINATDGRSIPYSSPENSVKYTPDKFLILFWQTESKKTVVT